MTEEEITLISLIRNSPDPGYVLIQALRIIEEQLRCQLQDSVQSSSALEIAS